MTEKEIIQKMYEVIKLVDCMQYNPSVDFNYLRAKSAYNIIKNQIEHIEAENAELKARLDKTVKFPCEITGNLSFTKTKGKKFTYMYEVAKQKIQTTLCIENDHFEIINDDVCFYFNRDDNHEAELKGGRE